jgi:hypothetical protein
VRTFARCFVVGSGLKTLLNVLVFAAFRRGRPLTARLVLRTLLDLRYGLFLGTYSSAWKALSCLTRAALRRTRPPLAPLPHAQPRSSSSSSSSSRLARPPSRQPRAAAAAAAAVVSLTSSGSEEVAALPGSLARPCSSLALDSAAATTTSDLGDHDHQQQPGGGGGGDNDEEEEVGREEEEEEEAAVADRVRRERWMLWAGDLAAGAASGLALYWLPRGDRKGLALYGLTRSGEFLARFLSANGLLPPLLERLAPHVDVALMTLSGTPPTHPPTSHHHHHHHRPPVVVIVVLTHDIYIYTHTYTRGRVVAVVAVAVAVAVGGRQRRRSCFRTSWSGTRWTRPTRAS